MKRVVIGFAVAAVVCVALVLVVGALQPAPISAEIVNLQALNTTAGFARADHARSFRFPIDHGPHPEYQTEWWYYTGNLEAADGRHFGYQLTFFRQAVSPLAVARSSTLATNQVYFAHLAITDARNNSHFYTERFSRGAADLAGATGAPYRVWLENWEVVSLAPDGDRVRLQAQDGGRALDLTLTAAKPVVLEGEQGWSAKSDAVGNASYYYSFTRLATEGTLRVNNQELAVSGLSWMDHEFGTTSLGPQAVGWDWFSIQLDSGRELMYFQIRNKDGSIEPLSGGTLVMPDGTTRFIGRDQVELKVLDRWKSPLNASYPARWTLAIPTEGLALTLKPYVADQEMRVSIPYWEGAVEISGTENGVRVRGSGYVEMTGYVPNAAAPVR